ncbi:Hypothetical predicted protein [Paramuricea clavata]|uniref:Uncharacterized protein n=1 Tax=Paramuricea clavata TaxID=317549 RepID=A0A6S7HMC7_PARCT|nr:Hypothetical predicted protein [Paramuricea clavata]
MATEISRETRSRSEARKEFDSYVQSEAFVSLLDDAISKQFEKFFSSEDFKKMLVATTTSVKQIEGLSAQLNKVKVCANENEQYSRHCNIRIFGLPELEDENCYEVVTEFCKTKLGYNLELREIDRTHRVGRLRHGKQRAIIVKFCSYQSKIKVIKSLKKISRELQYMSMKI